MIYLSTKKIPGLYLQILKPSKAYLTWQPVTFVQQNLSCPSAPRTSSGLTPQYDIQGNWTQGPPAPDSLISGPSPSPLCAPTPHAGVAAHPILPVLLWRQYPLPPLGGI